MKNHFYPQCQSCNPGRAPNWRWARAWELFNERRHYSPARDDAATGRALNYLRAEFGTLMPRYRRRLLRGLADVAAAHQIHGGPSGIRLEIEARILARQTAQQIGRRVDVPADVIVTYEALFYNIVDRLDAATYVTTVVIGEIVPEGNGKPDFARLIKWTAYNGGVAPLDAMLKYVARKAELELLGASSITMTPATQLAIDLFVATHALQTDEPSAFAIASKGRIAQEILETNFRRPLLADSFAAQTAAVVEGLATKAGVRTVEEPSETPVESESVEAA